MRQAEIYSDTTITLYLNKSIYEAVVHVIDDYNNKQVSAATVSIGNEKKVTNYNGVVTFQLPWNEYFLQVEKVDYRDTTRELTLAGDTTLEVLLEKISGEVEFRIQNNGTPVNGATVRLNEKTKETNNLGIGTFDNIPFGQTYDYSAIKFGYKDLKGSLFVEYDTTVNLEMVENLFNIEFYVEKEDSPLKEARVVVGEDTSITASDGTTLFKDYPGDTLYPYEIQKSGFQNYSDSVYVTADTTIEVALIPAGIYRESSNTEVKVYPNPAEKYVYLESRQIIEFIDIHNLKGMEMMKLTKLNCRKTKLDLSILPVGIYFLKIKTRANKYVDKILIIR